MQNKYLYLSSQDQSFQHPQTYFDQKFQANADLQEHVMKYNKVLMTPEVRDNIYKLAVSKKGSRKPAKKILSAPDETNKNNERRQQLLIENNKKA